MRTKMNGRILPTWPCRCDNCQIITPAELLEDVASLEDRVDEGGPTPAGECPECGALAYMVKEPSHDLKCRVAQRLHDVAAKRQARALRELEGAETALRSATNHADHCRRISADADRMATRAATAWHWTAHGQSGGMAGAT